MQRVPFGGADEGLTVNLLRSTISKYFIVNDIRYDQEAYAFFVQLDPRTLEEDFDGLRRELLDLGFVPMILREKPGYIVYVTRMPPRKFRSIRVNQVLLIATILSTIFAGMMWASAYDDLAFWTTETAWKGALWFAAPLLLILGIHELGHYYMARRHRVAASLPFFIPAPPPIFFLGTFGAAISLREPIHSKRALMDIGVAGPIAGFVVAIAVTVAGFLLGEWNPRPVTDDASEYLLLGTPQIFNWISALMGTRDDILIHPTAFAGWVGFLVTFLNLLPAGQLDGGHIVRALFGDWSKYASWATILAMVGVSAWTGYWGWALFLFFIILVLHHPPPLNDISPLPPNRVLVGGVAFIMLAVCFVPAPLQFAELHPELEARFDLMDLNVELGGAVNNTLVVVNTGNTRLTAKVRLQSDHGWKVTFDKGLKFRDPDSTWGRLEVPKDRSTNFTTTLNMTLKPPVNASLGTRVDFTVEVLYAGPGGDDDARLLRPRFTATVGWVLPRKVPDSTYVAVDSVSSYAVSFKNLVLDRADGTTSYGLDLNVTGDLVGTLTNDSATNLTGAEIAVIPPLDGLELANNETVELLIWIHAPQGIPTAVNQRVALTVTLESYAYVTVTFVFYLDVVNPIYDLSVRPYSDSIDFRVDEEKNISFTVRNAGTVSATARLAYAYDSVNWTMTRHIDEITVAAGDEEQLIVRLVAIGDVGDKGELEIEITYGPSWNLKASVIISLEITRPA